VSIPLALIYVKTERDALVSMDVAWLGSLLLGQPVCGFV
jgi:hypothetical protein